MAAAMHLPFRLGLVVICQTFSSYGQPLDWLPQGLPQPADGEPMLCVRDYLSPEQGEAVLHAAAQRFSDRDAWAAYAALARKRIQEGAGLSPWPRKTALNPVSHSPREYDGYSVENIAFESIPGYFAAGNLYRPLGYEGPRPAILSTHGHTAPIRSEADWASHGRFSGQSQARAAALARMGAVVLSIDMFGYGDSGVQFGHDSHRSPLAMTIQIWNAIRAVDYLSSLPVVDSRHVGVTGESGGGTQAFLLAALDDRIALSVPVVMVSSHFFGGCPCESGRPIHRSADHFVSNAMIAAMAAPRPQLIITDGDDWTRYARETEYPFLRGIYDFYGAADSVRNTHLPQEGHDYGPSKRSAMYAFVAKAFGLEMSVIHDADGNTDESAIVVEEPGLMRVFTESHPIPANALKNVDALESALTALPRR